MMKQGWELWVSTFTYLTCKVVARCFWWFCGLKHGCFSSGWTWSLLPGFPVGWELGMLANHTVSQVDIPKVFFFWLFTISLDEIKVIIISFHCYCYYTLKNYLLTMVWVIWKSNHSHNNCGSRKCVLNSDQYQQLFQESEYKYKMTSLKKSRPGAAFVVTVSLKYYIFGSDTMAQFAYPFPLCARIPYGW